MPTRLIMRSAAHSFHGRSPPSSTLRRVSHGSRDAAPTSPDARRTLETQHYHTVGEQRYLLPTKYYHSKKIPMLPYASGRGPLPLQVTFTSLVVHSTGACPAPAREGPLNIRGLQLGVGGDHVGVSHHSSVTCVHSLSPALYVIPTPITTQNIQSCVHWRLRDPTSYHSLQ